MEEDRDKIRSSAFDIKQLPLRVNEVSTDVKSTSAATCDGEHLKKRLKH